MSAYNETCASVGMDYWNHRQFLLHGDAKYIDIMERTLYNGLISGVSLKGDTFFYPNPLESNGQHARQEWFGVACCPGNITRFMASVPGYVYAKDGGRHALREPLRRRHGGRRSRGRHAQDRAGHALSVGRRGPHHAHTGQGARVHGQRAHSGLGARAAGAGRPVSFRRQGRRLRATLKVNGIAGRDDAGRRLRRRSRAPGRRATSSTSTSHAGPPHRRARQGDRRSRPRGAPARPDRLRRRVARQSRTARSATSSCPTATP